MALWVDLDIFSDKVKLTETFLKGTEIFSPCLCWFTIKLSAKSL